MKILSILKKEIQYKSNTQLFSLLSIALGAIAFMIIYGITPLNVTNDSWIMAGYDENDILQHYAGWLAFRASDWDFPIGMANKMAVGDGTFISFTDSIPWIAIIFKIFRSILPETFQYFGIYTLLCYMLQGFAGFKILYYTTKNLKYSLAGTILFCFSPILMERAFRHTALGSQWLILFSIYIYFKHRDIFSYIHYVLLILLEILSVGIHPYFLPMIACFSLLCLFQDIYRKKWGSVLFFLAGLIVSYAAGYLIGALGTGVSVERIGYGYFSMNINAILNPDSRGGYTWSYFLKTRPQTLGNYDGFNYLGIGIILLAFMVFFLLLSFSSWHSTIRSLKNYVPLIIICIFLFCFSISNTITWNDKILITIPLPEILQKICDIFRASSRLFYPVYYLIYIFLLTCLWYNRYDIKQKSLTIMLTTIIIVQLCDLHQVIIQKHMSMNEAQKQNSILQDDILSLVGDTHNEILLDNCDFDLHPLAIWAFKHNMNTYFSLVHSAYISAALGEQNLLTIKNKKDLGDSVIISTDENTMHWYLNNTNAAIYEYSSGYFIYTPKSKAQ
jgi:hypothetical protein